MVAESHRIAGRIYMDPDGREYVVCIFIDPKREAAADFYILSTHQVMALAWQYLIPVKDSIPMLSKDERNIIKAVFNG